MLADIKDDGQVNVYGKLTGYTLLNIEAVGPRFHAFWTQKHDSANAVDSDSDSIERNGVDDGEDDESNDDDVVIEDDIVFLRSLDPKEWKKQDHYEVLGLAKVRYLASDGLIKKAYRKKVLTHHPDKRRSHGEKIRDTDSDYFTCITKAYEILGNPTKRQSFDSVDPEFEDSIPSANAHSKENFYDVFSAAFKRNDRWSNRKPVPHLGDEKSTVEHVNKFYSFWYDFDSWREFSYLDEEEKEKGESREERRWIEKQNKAARQKLKKEENARMRQLVDNAYACDPRIQKFKEEEKQRKLAFKRAKQEAIRQKAEEDEKARRAVLELERKAKAKEAAEARAKAEVAKKEKEIYQNSIKKERNLLRNTSKNHNYFISHQSELVRHMVEMDKLCELLPLERIEELNKSLIDCDVIKGREVFLKWVKELNDKLDKDKEELFNLSRKSSVTASSNSNSKQWSLDDVQLLIKAVNLFPAGTNQRWEVVSNYMNQHSQNADKITRTAKEVLTKAKDLQKSDTVLKVEANKQAYRKFEKTQKLGPTTDEAAPTERFDTAAEMQGVNTVPWTAEEQKLLEQALKTYPATTANRWDCIAECIPGRNKKDCMKRYKDLVEIVKAKKAAVASVSNSKTS